MFELIWFVFWASIFFTMLYFSMLASMFAAPAAAAAGAGLVLFRSAGAVGQNARASLDGIGIQPPDPGRPGEPAYRNYFFGPVFRDYGRVLVTGRRTTLEHLFGTDDPDPDRREMNRRRAWFGRITSLPKRLDARWWRWLTFLPVLAGAAALVAGAALGGLVVLLVAVIFALLVGALDAVALGVAAVLRVFESLSLRVRGITLECPECHESVTAPVYECPTESCKARHLSLLPGMLGVLHRICRCGTTLPTLLLNGKVKLPSYCSGCGAQLPIKGRSVPTFHLPVVAGPSAGKTAFMFGAVNRLQDRSSSAPDDALEWADRRALQRFSRFREVLRTRDPSSILKTGAAEAIHAFNIYVGAPGSKTRRLLYLYDPAGEHLQGVDELANWRFLPHTSGLVVIIDPFSLPALRRLLDRRGMDALRPSPTGPEEVLGRVVEALRERSGGDGRAIRKIKVAVVVTKADALVDLPQVGHPYDGLTDPADPLQRRADRDAAVREWLDRQAEQRNLVASLGTAFSSVSYFAVSAMDAAGPLSRRSMRTGRPVANDDPCDPLLWMLKGRTA